MELLEEVALEYKTPGLCGDLGEGQGSVVGDGCPLRVGESGEARGIMQLFSYETAVHFVTGAGHDSWRSRLTIRVYLIHSLDSRVVPKISI